MHRRPALDADRRRAAELAATLQTRPERHIAYLGTDAATIAEEMVAEDDDWTAVTSVLEDDGRLVGWLMGSVDAEMGRVWWFGPFLDAPDEAWPALADSVYDDARTRLPESVRQEELAVDSRFTTLGRWATARGFLAETGSAVLVLDDDLDPPSVPVRPVRPQDAAALAPLHERLFAGTHLTGEVLVSGADAAHLRLVAERDGVVVGYVAVERQPDGEGYIDFLGVAEQARRAGLGSELVRAGVHALRGLGCRRVSLTVRSTNDAARSLYAGLGFVQERVIDPFRIGFSLG